MRSNKKAFTLIELMVVLAIIVVLSLIAAPVVTTTRNRAITEEAMGGLSHLRVALKEYYFIHNAYQDLNGPLTGNYPDGVHAGDLDGIYFQDGCYEIDNPNGHIFCRPNMSTNRDARNLSANSSDDDFMRMDRDTGDLWESGVPTSGFKTIP